MKMVKFVVLCAVLLASMPLYALTVTIDPNIEVSLHKDSAIPEPKRTGSTTWLYSGRYYTTEAASLYYQFKLSALQALVPSGYRIQVNSAKFETAYAGSYTDVNSVPDGDPMTSDVYSVTDDNWTEASIEEANKPALSTLLGSFLSVDQGPLTFSTPALASFVEQQVNGDGVLSLEFHGVNLPVNPDPNFTTTRPLQGFYTMGVGDWGSFKLVIDYSFVLNDAPDLSGDKKVNLVDFAMLATNWLECTNPGDPACVVMPANPNAKLIKKAPNAITVDGDLADWGSITWTNLDKVYYGNAGDVSNAKYALRWDNNSKLYLAVSLVDNYQVYGLPTSWDNKDKIEIYCQGTAAGGTGYNSVCAIAQQYLAGPLSAANTTMWAIWPNNANIAADPNVGFACAAKTTGSTIVYEVALTAFDNYGYLNSTTTTPTALSHGKIVGFDVFVDTEGPSAAFGMLADNTNAPKWYNADAFTEFTLIDPSQCGSNGYLVGDVNFDCVVGLADLDKMADYWLDGV